MFAITGRRHGILVDPHCRAKAMTQNNQIVHFSDTFLAPSQPIPKLPFVAGNLDISKFLS